MPSDVVQKLRDFLDSEPELKADFEEAFEKAKGYDLPEFKEWGIETTADYLGYYEKYIRWVPTETKDGTSVIYHLCIFYFVLDQPSLARHQSDIVPATRAPYTWLSEWIIEYAKEMGKWMDSPESITEEAIDTFYQTEAYHMDDYDRKPWKTFNEFFARYIKPERRQIDAPSDDRVIVSPADATFDGWWPVDDQGVCTFDAKGVPWSIAQLLDDEEGTYSSAFAGGSFCHSFLGPTDYHRQHAPVSGQVIEARVIEGLCYLEVEVVENDKKRGGRPGLAMRRRLNPPPTSPQSGHLNPPDTPGYQFIQARGLILIDNPTLGLVAILPIGMAQVSSVVPTVKQGDYVNKGEEISCFQFGGSDIVMVFQADAKVKFTAEKEKHYPFGKELAVASPTNGRG